MGSGIDLCYPKENIILYENIKQNHLILSEYPNDFEPKKSNFPHRNRLIAALGEKVVVIEAYPNSGTLITINLALQMNKDIYCVPFPIFTTAINNKLIKEGANVLENVDDLF